MHYHCSAYSAYLAACDWPPGKRLTRWIAVPDRDKEPRSQECRRKLHRAKPRTIEEHNLLLGRVLTQPRNGIRANKLSFAEEVVAAPSCW
jgi:hypothetical protein